MDRSGRFVVGGLVAVAVLGVGAFTFGSDGDGGGSVSADRTGTTAPADTTRTDPPSASTEPVDVGDESQTTDPSADEATTTTRAPDRRGSGEPVTFAFGGDVHFEGMIRPQLDANPTGLLSPIAPVLAQADIAVLNLETAVTEGGTPSAKEYNFRAPPTAIDALKGAGVDTASMANNHGLDFGVTGLTDSLTAARDRGFPLIGIGADDTEAYRPFTTTVRGQRVAVIGATQVLDNSLISAWTAGPGTPGLASAKDVGRLVQAVQAARAEADTVVVFLHWGVELATCPSGDQQALAQQLVDAGADIVVGGHAHRLQGAGRLGDAFVAYGLGNFVFYTPGGPGAETGVLFVTAVGRDITGYEWRPARISNGIPRPLADGDAAAAVAAWDALRPCTGLAP